MGEKEEGKERKIVQKGETEGKKKDGEKKKEEKGEKR